MSILKRIQKLEDLMRPESEGILSKKHADYSGGKTRNAFWR